MTLIRPAATEHADYFSGYVRLVPAGDLLEILEQQISEMHEVFGMLSGDQANVLHPPYTWTLKQVLGHLIDGERVFGYRMHRFATGDGVEAAGFDENYWVAAMDYGGVGVGVLLDEWISLRQGNIALAMRIKPDQWLREGISAGKPITVRAIGYILAGHILHHLRIVRGRLGVE